MFEPRIFSSIYEEITSFFTRWFTRNLEIYSKKPIWTS